MNQKLKVMLTSAIAITNEKDIKAIHGVVSDELKAQIEQSYPHLFSKQFDFSELVDVLEDNCVPLPFMVGYGVVEEKDKNRSLVVHSTYRVEWDKTESGYTVIRFIQR